MATIDDILEVSRIDGVDQYMLVNSQGKAVGYQMEKPDKTAGIIFNCMQNSRGIAGKRFKYFVFFRKNKKHFYIFPVGGYCLGVVKNSSVTDNDFTGAMINFLNSLLKK